MLGHYRFKIGQAAFLIYGCTLDHWELFFPISFIHFIALDAAGMENLHYSMRKFQGEINIVSIHNWN